MPMWIKICANTNLADAQRAAELGADALGFVFAPSKRRVTAEQVATIVPRLTASIEKIAVVQTRNVDEIIDLVRATGLTGVQLHGGLDLPLARTLHEAFKGRITLIQTLHWKVGEDAQSAAELEAQLEAIAAEPALTRVLIDAKVGAATGGTGQTFDWAAARHAFANAPARLDLILAGGLRPENVAEAIQILEPFGVDVASGVESEPGRKDYGKLRHFIENAR
jgi:phosphoribosylanthranilate isomerase